MTDFQLDDDQRNLGTYVCGNPGSGKSSLLQQQILWDMDQRHGVCVIDPSGDLIGNFDQLASGEPLPSILSYIPEHRIDDVIYFDTSMPVPFDFFSYVDEDEKGDLVNDLAAIFNLSGAPVAKPYLIQLIYTLFKANENPMIYQPDRGVDDRCTFLDISRFLTRETRMHYILSYCSRERQEQSPPYTRLPQHDTITAITIRLVKFMESKTLKHIVGANSGGINLGDVIENNCLLPRQS